MPDPTPGYAPTAEKLAALGYFTCTYSPGFHPSYTYANRTNTKAVVVWPADGEVRLCHRPTSIGPWEWDFTGRIASEAAFDNLAADYGFTPSGPERTLPASVVAAELWGLCEEANRRDDYNYGLWAADIEQAASNLGIDLTATP